MSKIVVVNHVTLDGVMQSPARPGEDPRDGFRLGGWAIPYADQVMMSVMGERMQDEGSMLFGRVTYENLFHAWHGRTDNPFTEVLDKRQKYVASNTLTDPLPWQNSTLLSGDATDAVAELKASGSAGDLGILGSGELIRSLMARNLIDEFLLTINPLVLGSGRRLFTDGGPPARFELVECQPTTTGVLIARYRLAEGAPSHG